MMITDFKDLDLSKQYTYADYLSWRFSERVELLKGWVKKMSPAPDLIVEVLSPGNSSREKKDKFELYEENGVLEYWMVSPMEETILVYDRNAEGKYLGRQPAVAGMTVSSKAIPGFSITVDKAFAE